MQEKAIHLFFEGRVQGVGFRFTARSLAAQHSIKGWVRNLTDGRVEVVAQGSPERINYFLEGLHQEFKGYIMDCDREELPVSSDYKGFQIVL